MIFASKIENYLEDSCTEVNRIINEHELIDYCDVDFRYDLQVEPSEGIKKEETMLKVEGRFPFHSYYNHDEVIGYYFEMDGTTLNNLESLSKLLIEFLSTDLKKYENEYEKNNPDHNDLVEKILFEELYAKYQKSFYLEWTGMQTY